MTPPEITSDGEQPVVGRPSLRLDPDSQSSALGRRIALFAIALLISAVAGAAVVHVNPLLVLGAILCCIFVLTVMQWPFVGLLFYVLIYVLRVGEMYPALAPLRLERVVGVLTLVSLILAQLHSRGDLAFDHARQTRKFLLLLLAAAASIPLAYWRSRAIDTTIDMAKVFIFYLLVVQLLNTRQRFHTFVFTYGVLIVYLALTSIKAYFSGGLMVAQGIERAVGSTSAGGGPNEMGASMASMIPMLMLLSSSKPLGRWRLVFGAGLGLMLTTMALTGSRSAMLGFLAGMIYLWSTSRRKVLYGTLGLIFIVGGFVALPGQYKGRYETITSNKLDESSSERLRVWRTGASMIAHRPLTGVGIGCFGTANALAFGGGSGHMASYLESHNLYVQVPSEMGVLGAIAFFGFIIELMRLNRRTARALQASGQDWALEMMILKGMFTGIVVLLVTGMFGHSLMRHTWYLFAALGLSAARIYLASTPNPSEGQRRVLLG